MRVSKKRRQWAIVVVLALSAITVGGAWACRARQNELVGLAPGTGDLATAFVGNLNISTSASGQLEPRRQARLALANAGRVEGVYVRVGDRVQAGDILVQLETDHLERAIQTAEADLALQQVILAELLQEPDRRDVDAARAAVIDAQAQVDDLMAGPSEEDLAHAQAASASAQARLDDLLAGPGKKELDQAQAALTSAQAGLKAAKEYVAALDEQLVAAQNDISLAQKFQAAAQKVYGRLFKDDWRARDSWAPYSPSGVAVKKAQIYYDTSIANRNLIQIDANDSALRSAQAQVAQAEANLAALTDPKTAQISAARAQVARAERDLALLTEEKTAQTAAAQAQLAQAQASLARLLDGPSEEQVSIATARVELARISLQDAQGNLENAKLIAPFDGLIMDVRATVGEQASGPVVEMISREAMQVVLDVDEVDLGQIQIGDEALVTLDARADLGFKGTVASIAPRANDLSGIVTYQVRLDVDWTSDSGMAQVLILAGMMVDAELITSRRTNVLLVPNQAIKADRERGTYRVNLVRDDAVQSVQIAVGARDSNYTEIISGIQEGDQLMTSELERGSSPWERLLTMGQKTGGSR